MKIMIEFKSCNFFRGLEAKFLFILSYTQLKLTISSYQNSNNSLMSIILQKIL